MHYRVAKLMRQGKSHPVTWRAAIQKNAWREITDLHRDSVDGSVEIAPDYEHAGSFTQVSKVLKWAIGNQPSFSNYPRDSLRSAVFIDIERRKWKGGINIDRSDISTEMD